MTLGVVHDTVTSVMDTLKALNVTNIIKKDIQNIQTLFLKNENGKKMFLLISYLKNAGYTVRIQVEKKSNVQEVKGFFFIHDTAIQEARIWPEAITIDATYKTNAHKLSLVNNIVGTSNASSVKGSNRLQTFAIAAVFVNSETEDSYTWILEELREAIWPTSEYTLPSVFVTDNEKALRNAISSIFPESQHLPCSWHLWNTMATKLPIGTIASVEYNLRRTQAELEFKAIMSSYNEASYKKALGNFEQLITTPGYFKNNGNSALLYLKDVLLQENEIKHWVGIYANNHPHMGNRTSSRAESFHWGPKRALGNQSASKLTLTVKRMSAYYEKKRADRNRQLGIERISIDSILFDKEKEYRVENLIFKVVRFAMDKIRANTIASLKPGFVSKGADCKCWDRIRYKLPCPCIISASPQVLPLGIVDRRWRFEHDEGLSEGTNGESPCDINRKENTQASGPQKDGNNSNCPREESKNEEESEYEYEVENEENNNKKSCGI